MRIPRPEADSSGRARVRLSCIQAVCAGLLVCLLAPGSASADRGRANTRGAEGPDALPRMGATATIEPIICEPPPPMPKGLEGLYAEAERRASDAGRRVLSTARRMMAGEILVIGSCWDYANAVFTRAGHPLRRGYRKTVFKGSRSKKRFANVSLIQPGDWLYYVNHQYRNVPHSAIFVAWLDRRARRALMITYRGARRRVPGTLDEYDLRSVYRIIRPVGDGASST